MHNPKQKFENLKAREKALRAALNAAYPYADFVDAKEVKQMRRIWNDEIRRARGLKPPLWTRKRAIRDVEKLIANEKRYGTQESLERLVAALPWRPPGV